MTEAKAYSRGVIDRTGLQRRLTRIEAGLKA
jgi:hypothetical protein